VKLTIFGLDEEGLLKEVLKNGLDMVDVFPPGLGINKDIVQINKTKKTSQTMSFTIAWKTVGTLVSLTLTAPDVLVVTLHG